MYNDDAFATMLLTVPLSADRAEYARPLSTPEYSRMLARVKSSAAARLGALLHVDISGLMMLLGVSEEEGYRLYTLLHRGVQLTYALEGFMEKGVRIVTCFDEEYPPHFRARRGTAAPPALFFAGERALLDRPAVAVVGVSGVKTTPEVRQSIEGIVRGACELGYSVVTGGELGVSRVAASLVAELGGTLIDVPAGGLLGHGAGAGGQKLYRRCCGAGAGHHFAGAGHQKSKDGQKYFWHRVFRDRPAGHFKLDRRAVSGSRYSRHPQPLF